MKDESGDSKERQPLSAICSAHSYDESFKALLKHLAEPVCRVITDYEVIVRSKRVDALVIEADKPLCEHFEIFSYFKKFNIVEFKSERDSFRFEEHMSRILSYPGGFISSEGGRL